jgi:hypothetical protein
MMATESTPIFAPAPSAMLVGVEDDDAERCSRHLAPLRILRVRHAAAACERMLATHPFVVVLGGEPREEDLDAICAHARDVRAQVVLLRDFGDDGDLRATLIEARRASQRLRGERSS